MAEQGADQQVEWSRDTQKFAVLSWISFLSASAFTMLFFAFIDPLFVVDSLNIAAIDSRNAGYAIGFFFLWANSWVACWLTVRLIRRKRHGPTAWRPEDEPGRNDDGQ
jgi:hypothetical protein